LLIPYKQYPNLLERKRQIRYTVITRKETKNHQQPKDQLNIGQPLAKEADQMIVRFVMKDAHVPASIQETMNKRDGHYRSRHRAEEHVQG